jgi:hypothetical protein
MHLHECRRGPAPSDLQHVRIEKSARTFFVKLQVLGMEIEAALDYEIYARFGRDLW